MVDTTFAMNTELDCRICHDDQMTDEHHVLYGKAISSSSRVPFNDTDGNGVKDTTYNCLSCHGTAFAIVRDCTACHLGSINPNRNPPLPVPTSPHHQGDDTYNRHCTECHGDLIANYDDGHDIPTYNPSLVTPHTSHTNVGWNDPLHEQPWHETDGGSGNVKDTDVLTSLDNGFDFGFGTVLTRNEPNVLRFKPAGIENDFSIGSGNRTF